MPPGVVCIGTHRADQHPRHRNPDGGGLWRNDARGVLDRCVEFADRLPRPPVCFGWAACGALVPGVPAGSKVFGVGNDWDTATPRTLTAGQSLLVQNLDTSTGEAQWVQRVMARTTSSRVVVSDSTPSSDQWNLAAIAVRAAPASPLSSPSPASSATTPATPTPPRPGPTGTAAPAPIPTPTSAPASIPRGGVANQANTGYENAPGYPGHLTDCSSIPIQSNTTYKFCDFPDGSV